MFFNHDDVHFWFLWIVQKELEFRGVEIQSSGFERIPQVTKELTTEQVDKVEKLQKKIKGMTKAERFSQHSGEIIPAN